ncbi:MAG: Lpg1974 family pore-forming outer membrane protein [Gammaproteobacteria bacterium]
MNRGYQGGGGRFGANLAQDFQYNLGVEGSAAMALLTGTQYSNTSFAPNSIPQRLLSSTTVVPELEAKLGLTYTSFLQNNSLIWNVGWMWIHYFNGNLYDKYNLPSDISVDQASLSLSLQGLYFGFRYLHE